MLYGHNLLYSNDRFGLDLPKFIFQSRVGNGKFMKTFLLRVDSSPVLVKVYLAPIDLNKDTLLSYVIQLSHYFKTLSPSKCPNLMPYQIWLQPNNPNSGVGLLPGGNKVKLAPIYLIRQYFSSNLNDRLRSRPFLVHIEKLWFVFQLLKCLVLYSYSNILFDILMYCRRFAMSRILSTVILSQRM